MHISIHHLPSLQAVLSSPTGGASPPLSISPYPQKHPHQPIPRNTPTTPHFFSLETAHVKFHRSLPLSETPENTPL